MGTATERGSSRVSLLIELADRPGALERVLHHFSHHGVNLTHIESRPAHEGRFDFYVDCEGQRGDPAIECVIDALERDTLKLLVLDERRVPWFPRHISELDLIANNTLDAGSDLQSDHPGFNDATYRARRAMIDELARNYRHGQPIPLVEYTPREVETWGEVYRRLTDLHRRYACAEFLRVFDVMAKECGYAPDNVPQVRTVNDFLRQRTGFRLRPVAGLLGSRDFLNGLAFRVFFSTQYLRHHSKPLYTPEPDVVHELVGHAPMFADPAFADLSQEIGLASLGASDEEIERLARCYWFSVEFGLVREQGELKAYGAGLLSSFGELEYACSPERPAGGVEQRPCLLPWEPAKAAARNYPITEYQPCYFVAESLQDAKARMQEYCRTLARPFYARYNPASESIWVDRAVRRNP
ncbi:MAG TPA: ACT domain-containing protein [Pseudomonadales bacterium]